MGKKRSNANYRRTILRPPYLDHSKLAVLNSFCLPASCRVYQSAIDQFIAWYCSEPRLACNPIVVVRYRMHLDGRGLAPTRSTSNWLRFDASHTKPPTPNVEPRAGCWDQPGERCEAARATLWELAECGTRNEASESLRHARQLAEPGGDRDSLFPRQCLGHAGSGIELLCGRKRGCGTAE
jgi:hypothetical protein